MICLNVPLQRPGPTSCVRQSDHNPICTVVLSIGVGTGGGHGAMVSHFSAKIIPKLLCFVEGFVFAHDEMEVSLTPSLLVTFLRPWLYPAYY